MPASTSLLRSLTRALLRRARSLLHLRPAPSASRVLGEHAEHLAQQHLASQGFTPISRNAITRAGEADLIMRAPTGELVIIEVKSRTITTHAAPPPELAIDAAKLARLRSIASLLARQNPSERVRVDALAVDLDAQHNALAFRHYPSIFPAH